MITRSFSPYSDRTGTAASPRPRAKLVAATFIVRQQSPQTNMTTPWVLAFACFEGMSRAAITARSLNTDRMAVAAADRSLIAGVQRPIDLLPHRGFVQYGFNDAPHPSTHRHRRRGTSLNPQAFHLPNNGGKSRHGLPVRAIHSTASVNKRASPPVRPGSDGFPRQNGCIFVHCASVRQNRSITQSFAFMPLRSRAIKSQQALGLPLTIFRLDIRLVDPDRQRKHENADTDYCKTQRRGRLREFRFRSNDAAQNFTAAARGWRPII